MSGVIKHEQEVAKNSFAMKLCCLVEAEGCTGYVADVSRELDLKEGYGLVHYYLRMLWLLVLYVVEVAQL